MILVDQEDLTGHSPLLVLPVQGLLILQPLHVLRLVPEVLESLLILMVLVSQMVLKIQAALWVQSHLVVPLCLYR